jgi:hypothetical protein
MPNETTITASFTNFLRRTSRLPCPVCGEEIPDVESQIKQHLNSQHKDLLAERDVNELVQEAKRGGAEAARRGTPSSKQHERPGSSEKQSLIPELGQDDDSAAQASSRFKSPITSPLPRPRSTSPPRRSRAVQQRPQPDPEFRRTHQAGKLWSPENDNSAQQGHRPSRQKNLAAVTKGYSQITEADQTEDENEAIRLIKEPETRPISQEQLVAEVKGIYAGLVMVETKCIEVDNAQSSHSDTKLNNEQWQALIALHRTLLHEHHDFFLASQHPSASPALRRLALKYAMPARMWRHGIHSFLELLRHRLPASLEHMLTFIYLAYSMMALLYETVPAFEDTWIECLGDLGRYRMAIEDEDIRDREVWTSVSRHWYSKASDKKPDTGRLYHHLAILARPNALQQLFYYTKSLCVPLPFASARESIMTLFDPILNSTTAQPSRLIPIDAAFVKAHGILFSEKSHDGFDAAVTDFLGKLDNHIGRTTRRWMESGYYVAIANCCAILSYGKEDSVIMKTIRPQRPEDEPDMSVSSADNLEQQTGKLLDGALKISQGTYKVVFPRLGDPNILPFLHVTLTFVYHLTRFPNALALIEKRFPWKLLSALLNSILLSYRDYDRIQSGDFPTQGKEQAPRPLPEDFAMNGLVWVESGYYPQDWFSNEKIDDDEKYFEVASMTDERKERVLWLACRIADSDNCEWLEYNQEAHEFRVKQGYQGEDNTTTKDTDMLSMPETVDSSLPRTTTLVSLSTAAKESSLMDVDTGS